MKRTVTLVLLLLLALAFWHLLRQAAGPMRPAAAPPSRTAASAPASAASESRADPDPLDPMPIAIELNAPGGDIQRDLQIVSEVVDTFRSNFPRAGNPTGTNAEITAALTGRNLLRLVLLRPDHPAINAAGELTDRWGTPFFFHAESGTRMEIRSAGPDRRMWTDDDVEFP